MTSLKSIMERRTMQVLDVRDMKNLKGGVKVKITIDTSGGGLPPPIGGGSGSGGDGSEG